MNITTNATYENQTMRFDVIVKKGDRTKSTFVNVLMTQGDPPKVRIRYKMTTYSFTDKNCDNKN